MKWAKRGIGLVLMVLLAVAIAFAVAFGLVPAPAGAGITDDDAFDEILNEELESGNSVIVADEGFEADGAPDDGI